MLESVFLQSGAPWRRRMEKNTLQCKNLQERRSALRVA